jgi:hypothetical protein
VSSGSDYAVEFAVAGSKAQAFASATLSPEIRHKSRSDVGVHLHHVSRRTQVTLTDRQHAFLVGEAIRTGLSLAELVRRAVDRTYRPEVRPKIGGVEVSLGLWRRPDAAVAGRRPEPLVRGKRRLAE